MDRIILCQDKSGTDHFVTRLDMPGALHHIMIRGIKGKSIKSLMEKECKKGQVSPIELKNGCRRKKVSIVRKKIACRSLKELGSSYAEIARYLGVNTSLKTSLKLVGISLSNFYC